MKNGEPTQTLTRITAKRAQYGLPSQGTCGQAEMREDPVERAVGRVEQPEPRQRAHRRRNDPRDQQHAAPFALALVRDVVDEMGDDKADHRLEDDGRDGEQHRLLDHHPERVALEQEE